MAALCVMVIGLLHAPHGLANGQDEEAKRLMNEASICRRVGIKSHFDPKVMEQACGRFKEAAGLSRGRLEAAAEAGLSQCRSFVDHGEGTVGRFMPLLAALEDPLSELREINGGAHGAALSKAIAALGTKVAIAGHKQLPFVVRCDSVETELCDGVKDSVVLNLKGNGLFGIDDVALTTYGLTSERLGTPGSTPDAGFGHALMERKGWPLVIVVDAKVHPLTDCTEPTALVGLSAKKWTLKTGAVTPLASASGLAVDGLQKKWAWAPLFIIAALLAFVFGLQRSRSGSPLFRIEKANSSPDLNDSKRHAGMIGLACAAVAVGSAVAFPISALPLIEGLSLGLNAGVNDGVGNLLAEVFVYPLALGALLYLGPAVFAIIGEAAAQAQIDKLSMLGLKKVQWVELVPSLQLGAAVGLGQHFILSMGTVGYVWAAALAVPPCVLSIASIKAIQYIHDEKSRLPLAISALSSLLYLPLLSLMEPTSVGVAIGVALVGAAVVFKLSSKLTLTEDADEAASVTEETLHNSAESGSIVTPKYLNEGVRELESLQAMCATEGRTVQDLWLVGETGAGKTRAVDELLRTLRDRDGDDATPPLLIGRAAGERLDSGEGEGRTFGFASDLLAGVFPLDARHEMLERQQEARAKALEAAQALSGFAVPGVGLLLDFADGDPPPGLTTSWLAEDVAESLLERSKSSRIVLFLDDLDQADTESTELLARIRDRLKLRQHDLGHPIYIVVTTHAVPEKLSTASDDSVEAKTRAEAFRDLFADYPSGQATELIGLDTEGVLRLTLNAGVDASMPSIEWLSEQAQPKHALLPQPGAILALLAHLDHVGLIELTDSGERRLASRETLDNDKSSIPSDIIGIQTERLKALDVDDCFVLKMAAECGRRFTARTLAAGLERKPLHVLRVLHRIERDTGFVHDDEQEDVFQFASESVRRALHRMTRRGLIDEHCGDEDAEILRVFHYQMAMALKADVNTRAEVLLRHCSHAGVRLAEDALEAAMEAAEKARRLMAFRRMKGFVDIARTQSRRFKASDEQLARLDFLEAYACKNLGGQNNRDRAFELFNGLLQSDSPGPGPETYPEFEALQAMLEGLYEEKQRDEQELLAEWRWSAETPPSDPLCPVVLGFYRAIAESDLRRSSEDLMVTVKRLITENDQVEVQSDEGKRHRALLRARLLQKLSEVTRFEEEVSGPERLEVLKPLWVESLALKREHGDPQGQALTLGTQGNFFNWTLKDYPAALALYKEDLALIEKMGDDSQLSSIFNRIAIVHFSMAQSLEGEAKQEGLQEAIKLSKKALEWGLELEREGDIAFAAETVMTHAAELGDEATFNSAIEAAMNPAVWEAFGGLGWMIGKYQKVKDAADKLDLYPRLQAVLAVMQEVLEERPLKSLVDALEKKRIRSVRHYAEELTKTPEFWKERGDNALVLTRLQASREELSKLESLRDKEVQSEALRHLDTVIAQLSEVIAA
jgi:hypothetical protein